MPENVLIDTDGAVRLIGFAVDAALHGLPAGRVSTDIADLVGLLYAAMTGKWAGVSRSVVPAAPSTHGHVLRPRQVRAGIPRDLDSLCEYVLNHGGDTEVTAAMLADSLRDFLGPSASAAEAWLARIEHPQRGEGMVVLPPLADPPVRDALRDQSAETGEPAEAGEPDEVGGHVGRDTGRARAAGRGGPAHGGGAADLPRGHRRRGVAAPPHREAATAAGVRAPAGATAVRTGPGSRPARTPTPRRSGHPGRRR